MSMLSRHLSSQNFDSNGYLNSIAPLVRSKSNCPSGRNNYLEFFKIFMKIGTELSSLSMGQSKCIRKPLYNLRPHSRPVAVRDCNSHRLRIHRHLLGTVHRSHRPGNRHSRHPGHLQKLERYSNLRPISEALELHQEIIKNVSFFTLMQW